MGGYPPHETGPGGFPRPGDAATNWATATEEVGRNIGVHLGRGGERGGGVQDNENIHSKKLEYGRVVYCGTTNSGPVQGGREEAGVMGGYEVVGTGDTWTGGGKGDGGGGGGQGCSGGVN